MPCGVSGARPGDPGAVGIGGTGGTGGAEAPGRRDVFTAHP
jgi:hypothetical protein